LNLQALESKQESAPEFNKMESFVWMLAHLQSFLDMPMVVIFGTFMFLVWVHYIHDQYLIKQIEVTCWTFQCDTTNAMYYWLSTLYDRDLTTTNLLDLYLSDDAAPQDAYKH
jgi:hypothetical protein